MGRKADQERIEAVLQLVREREGQLRAADIARELGVPKSSITRLLPAIDEGGQKWLTEDDRGFLGILR